MAHIHEQLERAHSICLASHQRIIAAIEFPLAAHELLCSPHIFVREVKEFVGDFNEFFEELKLWTEDAVQIKTRREFFEKKYPKMFGDSSESEMDIDVDTTMETKPTIERVEKLRKVKENC